MDVLSDTLQVVRLTGAIFLKATFAAPWSIESPPQRELARGLRLPTDCVALFHVLTHGEAWVTAPEHAPTLLQAGDAILLPHSPPHVISSRPRLAPTPMIALFDPTPQEGIPTVEVGGAGEVTRFICGFLHCDQRFNPLIGALPALIIIRQIHPERQEPLTRRADGATAEVAIQRGEWLEESLRYMAAEALDERPGGAEMLSRLSEILFVEVVRRYMQQLPETHEGWLAGVRDPLVGQTLRLLHAHPERAWTVEALADEVAVARSTLAQRFTALVGEAPMHYLGRWRIQLAKHLLRRSNLRLAEIAGRVGYESEAAFSRAFRRYVGAPPAAWREVGDSL